LPILQKPRPISHGGCPTFSTRRFLILPLDDCTELAPPPVLLPDGWILPHRENELSRGLFRVVPTNTNFAVVDRLSWECSRHALASRVGLSLLLNPDIFIMCERQSSKLFVVVRRVSRNTIDQPVAGVLIHGPARGANGAPQSGPGWAACHPCRIGSGREFGSLDV
jgi:hypothetical protein